MTGGRLRGSAATVLPYAHQDDNTPNTSSHHLPGHQHSSFPPSAVPGSASTTPDPRSAAPMQQRAHRDPCLGEPVPTDPASLQLPSGSTSCVLLLACATTACDGHRKSGVTWRAAASPTSFHTHTEALPFALAASCGTARYVLNNEARRAWPTRNSIGDPPVHAHDKSTEALAWFSLTSGPPSSHHPSFQLFQARATSTAHRVRAPNLVRIFTPPARPACSRLFQSEWPGWPARLRARSPSEKRENHAVRDSEHHTGAPLPSRAAHLSAAPTARCPEARTTSSHRDQTLRLSRPPRWPSRVSGCGVWQVVAAGGRTSAGGGARVRVGDRSRAIAWQIKHRVGAATDISASVCLYACSPIA